MTQRTITQNSSFWLSCDLLAGQLNDAGLNINAAIEQGLLKNDIPWTQQNIVEVMARPIMKAMWPDGPPDEKGRVVEWKNPDKPSTTQLSTKQISEVWEVLNRAISQRFGIQAIWASKETQYDESQGLRRG